MHSGFLATCICCISVSCMLFVYDVLRPIHTHTHLTTLCPGLPGWAGTRKVKTNLDFTEARDSEWQWHQLGRMQVCTSNQTDNHASTQLLSFLQAGCPSCRPTNSVKALKAILRPIINCFSSERHCFVNCNGSHYVLEIVVKWSSGKRQKYYSYKRA